MPGWADFRTELDALDGDARRTRALEVIAANQAALDDDPPGWLLDAARSRAMAEDDLETEDFPDVELLAIGGPVFSIGSPAGGEHITKSRLKQIAADTRTLTDAGELKPTLGLSHSLMQKLLRDSGLTRGEIPTLGDIEGIRLNEEGTKIVGDLKRVPKKVAGLMRVGAYRFRSSVLRSMTSQADGNEYELVIHGADLLGQTPPAIRTLDDVVDLYRDQERALEDGDFVAFAEGDVIWQPSESFEAIRQDINAALNPGGGDRRYWARDVSSGKALVTDWREEGKAWVVEFTRGEDGTVTLAPAADWVEAEEAWVETARSLAERAASNSTAPADTSDVPELTFTEDTARELAETLGLEGDDITPEKVAEKVGELKTKADAGPEEKRELEETELGRALADEKQAREQLAEELKTVQEERRLEQRTVFVEGLLRDGKIQPADREKWETRFDKDAEMARSFAADLDQDDTLLREFGKDDAGGEPTDAEAAYMREFAEREGVPEESLL